MSMRFILSYVNLPDEFTAYLDKEFPDVVTLHDFVICNYPEFTSYQMIVVNRK